MPGRVVDLATGWTSLPDPIVVDTNLIVEYVVVPLVTPATPAATTISARRADDFFRWLVAGGGAWIVTPTIFAETIHAAIRLESEQERLRLGPGARLANGQPIANWLSLYKADPTILQGFLPDLIQLRRLLAANGLLLLSPDDLGPIAPGRSYDEELVHLVTAYGLDANDALILEARRFGLTDGVTLDADLRRAQSDFAIHTWL